MTYEKLNKTLNELPIGEYLIEIAYKYVFEDVYTITIEPVSVSPEGICWFCDWYEGQTEIDVHGILNTDNQAIHEAITSKLNNIYYMEFFKNT